MTRFMCRFCGRIFQKEDISTPMKEAGWVWMRDNCPVCRKGRDDWYVSETRWKYDWLGAVRYQRNVKMEGHDDDELRMIAAEVFDDGLVDREWTQKHYGLTDKEMKKLVTILEAVE